MTVNLSLLAGAGAQFFDNNGVPLAGGLVYTYTAGTTTPQASYTTSSGGTAHANPIVLDSAGRVPSGGEIWLTQGQSYKFVVKTSASVTLGTYDNIVGSTDPANIYATFATSSGSSLIGYLPGGTGAVATTVQTKLRQTISVIDFGADPTGVADSSAAILAAWTAAAEKELIFPAGTYSFYLNVSGLSNPTTVTGQGNVIFRPFSSTPANSAIIYCNNNNPYVSGVMVPMETTFIGISFSGRKLGTVDPVYGDVNYCVNLLYSSAKFYRCNFSYGKVAGFHALFGQYNEFYDCLFGANIFGGVAIGCFIESNGVPNSANENKFFSCKFNTNSVGLKITGGIQNKVYAAQIQANTVGLQIGEDGTGFGTNSNLFSGVYFEGNTTDIQGTVCVSQVFDACNFITAGSVSTFSTAYNLVIQNCSAYTSTTITINHPSGSADVASVTCIGNNFDPVLNLSHSGARSQLNINSANLGLSKNLNLWNTVDQNNNQTGGAYLTGPQYGFKSGILRNTATTLFSLIQYSTSSLRYSKFTLNLQCVEDELVGSSFGYAARNESFEVFITNNSSATPQVYTSTISGVDLGINTAFFAIGAITLTTVITGDVIQFRISWAGSGTNPANFPSICCGYTINYTGLGATTFLPL